MYQQPQPHFQQYEFDDNQNKTIGTTASRMQAFAIISLVLGALQAVASLAALSQNLGALAQTAAGGVGVVVGIFFLRGAERLRSVVKTQGDDVTHLMAALTAVGKAFIVQVIAVCVAFLVGAVLGGLAAAGLL